MTFSFFWGVTLCLLASAASAQYAGRQLAHDAGSAPDLAFPASATPLVDATSPRMMMLKPEGPGPFPAVALGHQCGGLVFNPNNPRAMNWSMLEWAKTFVHEGYVVLPVDYMGPRGARSLCSGPENGVNFGRSVKDCMQAAAHLRRQPEVNPHRVALVGFSQGAIIALLSNSTHVREQMKSGNGFNAFVSFYLLCGFSRNGPGNFAGELVQEDLERPHLVFTGGQDTETPFQDCHKRLTPLANKGKPIIHRHFDEATHCFDCKSLDGFTKRGPHGPVTYRFSEELTRQSARETFEFLRQRMPEQ